jgi:RsiW-degrading membrane proteinase PrsW (M82 family)
MLAAMLFVVEGSNWPSIQLFLIQIFISKAWSLLNPGKGSSFFCFFLVIPFVEEIIICLSFLLTAFSKEAVLIS